MLPENSSAVKTVSWKWENHELYSTLSTSKCEYTYVSEIVSDAEILAKVFGELWIHVENVEQVVPENLMQVAVGQRPHVARWLAHVVVQKWVLSEDIVFSWNINILSSRRIGFVFFRWYELNSRSLNDQRRKLSYWLEEALAFCCQLIFFSAQWMLRTARQELFGLPVVDRSRDRAIFYIYV